MLKSYALIHFLGENIICHDIINLISALEHPIKEKALLFATKTDTRFNNAAAVPYTRPQQSKVGRLSSLRTFELTCLSLSTGIKHL